jgi:membrane protein YdbS with pleckstrin-like domain
VTGPAAATLDAVMGWRRCVSMDGMGFPRKLLGADEYVVAHMRTHAKALVGPALGLIVVGALTGVGAALIPSDYRPEAQLAVVTLGMVLAVWWAVLPFLRWRTTTYTITNRRVISRRGILNKLGKELPLMRINDLSYDRSLMDRILGCGTLNIQTASDGGPVVLTDVPDVQRLHLEMSELLFGAAGQPSADDSRAYSGYDGNDR